MIMPPPIQVASLGFENSLILMVLALVVFGPRRLPEIGRRIGKIMYEVRKASNDFKFQMEEELRTAEDADRRKKEAEKNREQIPASAMKTDSQIPESEAGAPSPYPGEGVYPAVSPTEFKQEEPYPRILPPSTGEQVPAARPSKRAAQAKAPAAKKAVRAAKIKPATDKAPARVKKTRKAQESSHD